MPFFYSPPVKVKKEYLFVWFGFSLVWVSLHFLFLLYHIHYPTLSVWLHASCSSQSHQQSPCYEIHGHVCVCSADDVTPSSWGPPLTTSALALPLLLPRSHLLQSENNVFICMETLSKNLIHDLCPAVPGTNILSEVDDS